MILKKLDRFWSGVLKGSLVVSVICVIFMFVAVNFEIILRYAFDKPIIWITEGGEFALIYMTFLGAAWVLKKNHHVKVDIVTNSLKPRARAILNGITSLLGMIIVTPLIYFGITITWDHYVRGVARQSALEVPNVFVLWVIPVGAIFLFVEFIIQAYGFLKAGRLKE
ncbi:MAG: TRAP transporter small permease subunit [Chloroflexota bacterium]